MTTTTVLPQPTARGSSFTKIDLLWLYLVQSMAALVTVDTASGNVAIALPPAGLSSSATGQTNQNQEIIYRKISPDGNTASITGSPDGTQTLTSNTGSASRVRFKSDGTDWWVVG